MANDRRCKIYKYNILIKKTMVMNKVSVRETKTILESERKEITRKGRFYDVEERATKDTRNREKEREKEIVNEPKIRVIKLYAEVAERSSRIRQEERDGELREREEKTVEIRKIVKEDS